MLKRSRSTARNTSRPCVLCGGPVRDTGNGQEVHGRSKKHQAAVAKWLREEQLRNWSGE